MRTETFLDVTTAPSLGPQLQGLEPVDVLGVEEHVADGDDSLVDLERMTRENSSLRDNAGLVRGDDSALADKLEVVDVDLALRIGIGRVEDLGIVVLLALENEDRNGAPCERSNPGSNRAAAGVQESIELVHIIRGVVASREDRLDDQTAGAALNDEFFLGLEGLLNARVQVHVHVDYGMFVLVTEK